VLVVIEGGLLRIVQKNVDTDVAYMDSSNQECKRLQLSVHIDHS